MTAYSPLFSHWVLEIIKDLTNCWHLFALLTAIAIKEVHQFYQVCDDGIPSYLEGLLLSLFCTSEGDCKIIEMENKGPHTGGSVA